MAKTAFQGNPVNTAGDVPAPGSSLPSFTLTNAGLGEISNSDLAGKRVVFNIFPSVDTPVCAASVRKFNELASTLDNTVVFGVGLNEGAFAGLLARAVVVADENGKVLHTELVSDIVNEPNYDAAVAALKK
jgi:thiol peroxidase